MQLENSKIFARTLGEHILSLKQLLQPLYRYGREIEDGIWFIRPWWRSASIQIPYRFTPAYIATAYAFACGSTRIAWRRNRFDSASTFECRLGVGSSDTKFELAEDNGFARFPYYSPTFRTTITVNDDNERSYVVGELYFGSLTDPPSLYKSGGDDAMCGYFLGAPPFEYLNELTFVFPAYGPSP